MHSFIHKISVNEKKNKIKLQSSTSRLQTWAQSNIEEIWL